MKQGITFSKEFTGWLLQHNEHLDISYIETHGNNLEEFLENCQISLTNWHGNEGPSWSIDDLYSKDYQHIVEMFRDFLQQHEEYLEAT